MEPRPHETQFDGELLRVAQFDDYYIELYDVEPKLSPQNKTMDFLLKGCHGSHHKLGYRFWDKDEVIFEGRDFACPRGDFEAGKFSECLLSLLGFLALRPGDTDEEYFESYTPRQREWCEERTEDLRLIVFDLEEMHGTADDDPMPDWACENWLLEGHDWVLCRSCMKNYWEQMQ